INPTPVITTPAVERIQTICSGDALNFLPASTVPGTTYSWTASVSGVVTGITSSGTGAITDVPVNSGSTAGTVTYTITPHAGACNGASVSYVVTVRPEPTVAAIDQTICSGQTSAVAISNPNTVAGTTFTWVVESVTNVTGAAAGAGTLISQHLTSTDGVTAGVVVYRITPEANGCIGPYADVTVNVTPVPGI